jgi:hypothetical protein
MAVNGNRLTARFPLPAGRALSQALRIGAFASLGNGPAMLCDYIALQGEPPLLIETTLHWPDPIGDWRVCAAAGGSPLELESPLDVGLLTMGPASDGQRRFTFTFPTTTDMDEALAALVAPAALVILASDPTLPAGEFAFGWAGNVSLEAELTGNDDGVATLSLYRDGSWQEVADAGATLERGQQSLTLTLPAESAASFALPGAPAIAFLFRLNEGGASADACDARPFMLYE